MEEKLKDNLMYETLERVPRLAREKRRTVMSNALKDHLTQIKGQSNSEKKEDALLNLKKILESDEMYPDLAVENGAMTVVMTSLSSAEQDQKVFEVAADILEYLMKNNKEAKEAANGAGLPQTLVNTVSSPGTDRTIRIKAAHLLHMITLDNTAAQTAAQSAGAIETFVAMVTDTQNDKEVIGCAVDGLLGLVKDNRITQTQAVEAGTIRALLTVLQNRDNKKTLFAACSALEACLKDNHSGQTQAIQDGALTLLTELVTKAGGDPGVRGMGLWLFQTLSTHQDVTSEHLPILMALAQIEKEKTVLRDVVLSVYNITQNSKRAGKPFAGGKLVNILVACLVKPDNTGLAKEIGKVVCNILKDSEVTQEDAVDEGVLPVLMSQLTLHSSTNAEMQAIVCQILMLVCGSDAGRQTALQIGILSELQQLLTKKVDVRPLATLVIVLTSKEGVSDDYGADLLPILVTLLTTLLKCQSDPSAVPLAKQLVWVFYSIIDDNEEITDGAIKKGALETLLGWLKVKEVAVGAANAVRVLMAERTDVINQALDLQLIPTVAGALGESGLTSKSAGVLLWLLDDPTKDNEKGKQQVVDVGIIHRLYNFLGAFSNDIGVVQVVAWVVYHVTNDYKPGQQAVLQSGILPKLLDLLQNTEPDSQYLFPLLWSLFNVLSGLPEAVGTALSSGAAGSLIHLLTADQLDPMLAFPVLRILEILSTSEEGKLRLHDADAQSVITACMVKVSLNDVGTATAKDILKNLSSSEPPDPDSAAAGD